MKNYWKFMLAAFAIVAAVSCAKEEIEDPDAQKEIVNQGPEQDADGETLLVPMTITVTGENAMGSNDANESAAKPGVKTDVADDNKSVIWCENDVIAVYEAVKKAVEHARSGKGPYLVETMVYRWQGHYCGDPAVYRPKEYVERAHENCPIERFGKVLIEGGYATEEELKAIDKAMFDEIEAATAAADAADYPDASEALTDVYASDNERSVAR